MQYVKSYLKCSFLSSSKPKNTNSENSIWPVEVKIKATRHQSLPDRGGVFLRAIGNKLKEPIKGQRPLLAHLQLGPAVLQVSFLGDFAGYLLRPLRLLVSTARWSVYRVRTYYRESFHFDIGLWFERTTMLLIPVLWHSNSSLCGQVWMAPTCPVQLPVHCGPFSSVHCVATYQRLQSTGICIQSDCIHLWTFLPMVYPMKKRYSLRVTSSHPRHLKSIKFYKKVDDALALKSTVKTSERLKSENLNFSNIILPHFIWPERLSSWSREWGKTEIIFTNRICIFWRDICWGLLLCFGRHLHCGQFLLACLASFAVHILCLLFGWFAFTKWRN